MPVQQEEGLVEGIMARHKSGNFDQNEYINGYIKGHYKWVNVPFSMNNPEDVELYEYLKKFSRGKKTPYIKKLIREDMKNQPIYVDTPKIGKLVIK